MKEYLQIFKDYWSLILLAVYSIAYVYNYIFYSAFNIDVFQYITITDLLFFSVEKIFIIIIFSLLFEIVGILIMGHYFDFFIKPVIIKKLKNKDGKSGHVYNKKFANNIAERFNHLKIPYYLFLYSLFVAFASVLSNYLNILNLLKISIVTAGFIYFVVRFFIYVKPKTTNKQVLGYAFVGLIYFAIISMVGLLAILNADNVINSKATERNLSFDYLGKQYKVDEKLRFVGETSTNIFFYNKVDETSLIFPKVKIENLKTNPKDSFLFNRVNNEK